MKTKSLSQQIRETLEQNPDFRAKDIVRIFGKNARSTYYNVTSQRKKEVESMHDRIEEEALEDFKSGIVAEYDFSKKTVTLSIEDWTSLMESLAA